jgi:hypothetical protein
MNSLAVSHDLPDYLKSKYSVKIPAKNNPGKHKVYKSTLRQGVSEETPAHFKLNYIPVLNKTQKNLEISTEALTCRFSSDLKQNSPQIKPRFNYSEIKDQKFDFDTLKISEGMDVKAGNSARVTRNMPYSHQYSASLDKGFGLPRGEFNFEFSQPRVPRHEFRQLKHLNNYLILLLKKQHNTKPDHPAKPNPISSWEYPRQVNTPNKSLKKKRKTTKKPPSLGELDLFETDIKSKLSQCSSIAVYRDY